MTTNRWHSREELAGKASFNIGDRDQFACHLVKHTWYWTQDGKRFFGPFTTRKKAESSLAQTLEESVAP